MRFIHLLFLLFLPIYIYAVPTGLEHEFDRFVEQINQSTPFVENALSRFKTNYTYAESQVSSSYEEANDDLASTSNPISKIVYGYVPYNTSNSDYTNYKTIGADNSGMYVLEVQFKTSSTKPDISPMLDGRSVLFIAYGSGVSNPIIYRNADGGNLGGGGSNNAEMTSIGGFVCLNKNLRCDGSSGSHPSKTCSSSPISITNQTTRAGFYNSPTGTDVNLFYYVTGDFSLCATSDSARNCMSSSSCS